MSRVEKTPSGFRLTFGDEDGDCEAEDEHLGIEEPGPRGDGGDAGKRRRHQGLRTVWNKGLDYAGTRVEKGSRLAGHDVVSSGNLLCKRADGDNRHGIVGRAEIDDTHEQDDAELGATRRTSVAANDTEDVVDTSRALDHSKHSGGKQGDNDQRTDRVDPFPSHVTEVHNPVTLYHSGNDSRENADEKHGGDVDAEQCQDDDDEIGGHEPRGTAAVDVDHLHFRRHETIDEQSYQGSRENDLDIGEKLMAHVATLSARGGNGRVGYEGEVVAEESAAKHDRHVERHGRTRSGSHVDGQGSDGNHRTDRSADSHGDEARRHEKTWDNQKGGKETQGDVDCGLHGAGMLCYRSESAREDEDPDHIHDVALACTLRENLYAFGERAPAQRKGRPHGGHKQGHAERHLIEIANDNRRDKIDEQENDHRRDCQQPPARGNIRF